LAPGQSITYYFVAISGNSTLHNTATAVAKPSTSSGIPYPGMASVTDGGTANVYVGATHPAIHLSKTVYIGHDHGASFPGAESVTGQVGTPVTYCFEVTNQGDSYLDSIQVHDPQLGVTTPDLTLISGNTPLAPGASISYYYETTITGNIMNTASVVGLPTDINGNPLPDTSPVHHQDNAQVSSSYMPSVQIEKTVYQGYNSGAQCPGSDELSLTTSNGADVTYCFTVTNTGNTLLDMIEIDDAALGVNVTSMTLVSGSLPLDLGQSIVYFYETHLDNNLKNTAIVTATPVDPAGNPLPGLQRPTDENNAEVILNSTVPVPLFSRWGLMVFLAAIGFVVLWKLKRTRLVH